MTLFRSFYTHTLRAEDPQPSEYVQERVYKADEVDNYLKQLLGDAVWSDLNQVELL